MDTVRCARMHATEALQGACMAASGGSWMLRQCMVQRVQRLMLKTSRALAQGSASAQGA
jgi:hypothetical protein